MALPFHSMAELRIAGRYDSATRSLVTKARFPGGRTINSFGSFKPQIVETHDQGSPKGHVDYIAQPLGYELLRIDVDLHNRAGVAGQPNHVSGATWGVSGCVSIP